MDIHDVVRRLGDRTDSILTIEVRLQVQRLNEAGIPATVEQVEKQLGYPIGEASRDELRGVIAGLNAVNKPSL
ncbi:hypothetical protein ABZY58_11215 [Micromonospora tulbaghiae]|uniref:hypothetical protein n=1 Tax=Micromonospora tulbaghiae TaxID=479978 RepID=UPI00339E0616